MEKQLTKWDIVKRCEKLSHNDPIIAITPEDWERVKERFTKKERGAVAEIFEEYGGAKKYFEGGGEIMNFEGWVETILTGLCPEMQKWANYIDFASMLHDEYLGGWVEIYERVIIRIY